MSSPAIPESVHATLRVLANDANHLAVLEGVYRMAYAQCQIDILRDRSAQLDAATGTEVPMFLRQQVA